MSVAYVRVHPYSEDEFEQPLEIVSFQEVVLKPDSRI